MTESQANQHIFRSIENTLFQRQLLDSISSEPDLDNDSALLTAQEVDSLLTASNNNKILLHKLIYTLKSGGNSQQQQLILTAGVSLINALIPLLLSDETKICAYSYIALHLLADQVDPDELVESMMDQLICISWEYHDNETECFQLATLSSAYVELFGRGLEKMTRARDWMLFIPFLANYLVKTIHIAEIILQQEGSIYNTHSSKAAGLWEQAILLLTHNCLDFIEFLHTKTIAQAPFDFPLKTNDIGLENSDTKRRYLGYYLLNLIYEEIITNFDLQLAKTYFQSHHTMYNIKRPSSQQQEATIAHFNHKEYKPMFDIVYRCARLAVDSGYTFDRMYKLQDSLNQKDHHGGISLEDKLSDNDRQMINSRLYPLSYNGIASLVSLSLYDKIIYPSAFNTTSIGLFPYSEIDNNDALSFAKRYIGIILNLLIKSNQLICHADKGIFVLLYWSDHINTTVSIPDMVDKYIQGPCAGELVFPACRIIEILSSTASTCPNASIRFLTYKLIEKFLSFGQDETRVFFLIELLDRCPFPSMKTAAIGLFKDQINTSFNNCTQSSIFTSPFIVTRFFPLIFNFKSNWKDDDGVLFWEDYNYIMQALNIYFFLLLKDEDDNLTTVWSPENITNQKKGYLIPVSDLIQQMEPSKDIHLHEMQIDMMKQVIEKILIKIEQQNKTK